MSRPVRFTPEGVATRGTYVSRQVGGLQGKYEDVIAGPARGEKEQQFGNPCVQFPEGPTEDVSGLHLDPNVSSLATPTKLKV